MKLKELLEKLRKYPLDSFVTTEKGDRIVVCTDSKDFYLPLDRTGVFEVFDNE